MGPQGFGVIGLDPGISGHSESKFPSRSDIQGGGLGYSPPLKNSIGPGIIGKDMHNRPLNFVFSSSLVSSRNCIGGLH